MVLHSNSNNNDSQRFGTAMYKFVQNMSTLLCVVSVFAVEFSIMLVVACVVAVPCATDISLLNFFSVAFSVSSTFFSHAVKCISSFVHGASPPLCCIFVFGQSNGCRLHHAFSYMLVVVVVVVRLHFVAI